MFEVFSGWQLLDCLHLLSLLCTLLWGTTRSRCEYQPQLEVAEALGQLGNALQAGPIKPWLSTRHHEPWGCCLWEAQKQLSSST